MRPRIVEYLESRIGTGFFVPDYSFMFALAVLIGLYLMIVRGEKAGLDSNKVFKVALVMTGAAFLSSRLFVIVQNPGYHITHPLEMFKLLGVDTASSGAYIGGSIGAVLFAKRYKISLSKILDCCAPVAALAICLGRIGCFLNGCCYGTVSDLPWAMRFPEGSGPYYDHAAMGLIGQGHLSLPVHPTQLYEAAYGLALFFLLIKMGKYVKREGALFAILFILYPAGRFLNEFLRADDLRGTIYSLSVPQVFSVCAVFLALSWLLLKRKQPVEHHASEGLIAQQSRAD